MYSEVGTEQGATLHTLILVIMMITWSIRYIQREYFGDLSRGETRKCYLAHPVTDGITERRIIYFEICPLCSTPCLPAAAVAAISYPRAVVVAVAKGVWADDAWIGRRYSETLIRRCKKPHLARQDPNAPRPATHRLQVDKNV